MNKYKILAQAQGVTTGFIWNFGSYWTADYMPYTNLLAAQAISGIAYSITSACASDEYYENMRDAYLYSILFTLGGKTIIYVSHSISSTYISNEVHLAYEKLALHLEVSSILIDLLQSFTLPLVSGVIRTCIAPAELVENEVVLTGETIDNIVI